MQVSRDKQIRILDMKYNHDTGDIDFFVEIQSSNAYHTQWVSRNRLSNFGKELSAFIGERNPASQQQIQENRSQMRSIIEREQIQKEKSKSQSQMEELEMQDQEKPVENRNRFQYQIKPEPRRNKIESEIIEYSFKNKKNYVHERKQMKRNKLKLDSNRIQGKIKVTINQNHDQPQPQKVIQTSCLIKEPTLSVNPLKKRQGRNFQCLLDEDEKIELQFDLNVDSNDLEILKMMIGEERYLFLVEIKKQYKVIVPKELLHKKYPVKLLKYYQSKIVNNY